MKKICFAFIFFFLFLLPVSALDTSLKVYDGANLLSDNEEYLLRQQVEEFIREYEMDMVIVTTSYNEGKGTTAYAQDFYDYNGFGLGKHYDGILFLLDRTYGYDDVEIVTTGNAILIYDDSRINYIFNDISSVKNNGYYAIFSAFISSSSEYAALGVAPSNEHVYIDENGDPQYMDGYDPYEVKRVFPWFQSIIISLVVSSIIVMILIFKNKMVKKETRAAAYLDQSTVNYTRKEDRFITTHTSRKYVPRNTGGSSGGRSSGRIGGSSISRGSSGRSHGGGGRRL